MRLLTLQSSNLSNVGYDIEKEELVVVFQNGRSYLYRGVPSDVYLAIITDPESHGKAFNVLVKKAGYEYEEVEVPEGHV